MLDRVSTQDNPLLDHGSLPHFDRIVPAHVEPAMRVLLEQLAAELAALESDAAPTWSALIEPLERIGDRLGYSWGIVSHLMGVQDSDALRAAHEAVQPDVAILDIKMPKVNGLEAARQILAISPRTGIVIISSYDDTQYFVELLKFGSKGKAYILKSSMDDLDILLDAVEGVARGETILDPCLRERLPQTVLDQLESL